ncbi:MAG: prolyl oligopeptidase family serine peptidase [Gemmatimonadota bacterium]|nr:prolyl oligopeptidase family serine peptidase [Gemmatimonadota bacterium]
MKILRDLPVLLLALLLPLSSAAQQKRSLDHEDYDRWNRIQSDLLSKDGDWLAYRLVPGDGDARLIVRDLDSERELTVDRGAQPRFTADSRYLVALIEPLQSVVDSLRGEGTRGDDLPKDSLAIVELSSMTVTRVADVSSYRLPEDAGEWMAYLTVTPDDDEDDDEDAEEQTPEEESEGDDPDAPRLDDGSPLIVRMLESGAERRFEFASDYAFAADGSALYYTSSGDDGAADGVSRVGPSGAADPIARGEGRYIQLAVSDEGAVAFLTDRDDRTSEAPSFALYTAGDQGAAVVGVAAGAAEIPSGWAPSEHGDLTFSESGRRLFFGTAEAPRPVPENDVPEDERVEVDIWNWKDPYLQPMQLVQAEQEKERSYRAMLDLASGRVLQIATVDVPEVDIADGGDGTVALGTSNLPYRQLVSWDGRYSDLHLIDLEDGSRTLVAEMVRGGGDLSPGGRYVTRWDGFDQTWYAIDVETGEQSDLAASLDVPVHDILDDHPDALRPYGAAGWTEGDERFLLYDEFDIWAVDPTGQSAPRNVTEGLGRATQTRFRYLDLDRDDPVVPGDEDVYLTSFGIHTKASGVYRDRFDSNRQPAVLVEGDARFADVRKADDADVVTYSRATFSEFPDIWVADPDFDGGVKVTNANPQQSEYLWGSAELFEWTSNDGTPLQGILYKPEGFDPSEEYPMMVYFYERSSDGLHQYVVPAPGSSSINRSFYVSRGYLLFVPDIPYRIGYPGESAVDAVVPGVVALIDQGFVNRDRIGVQGHSWGGYQIAYMVTRSDIFAAAEAGAPVANMVSAYGGIRWASGMSRAFQYERTQSRIGGSLWDAPLRYIENSPIFTADKIRTPLLMMHNDEDGAVPWYQGIELFSALRRLSQPVWMLNYNGEAHGLREEHNQRDWAIRMQQFFDHYLMDQPVPVWMDEGVPAILKGETLGLELTTKKVISEEGDQGR